MSIQPDEVRRSLAGVSDPCLPVSILDLGLVEGIDVDPQQVRVRLVTTFTGCPGLHWLSADVKRCVQALVEARGLELAVEVVYEPGVRWTAERLTPEGRKALADVGCGWAALCPHCGSVDVVLEHAFGSSLCSARAYCPACCTPFEIMKGVALRLSAIPAGTGAL